MTTRSRTASWSPRSSLRWAALSPRGEGALGREDHPGHDAAHPDPDEKREGDPDLRELDHVVGEHDEYETKQPGNDQRGEVEASTVGGRPRQQRAARRFAPLAQLRDEQRMHERRRERDEDRGQVKQTARCRRRCLGKQQGSLAPPRHLSGSARREPTALPSAAVATDPPADLELTPLGGPSRTIGQQLTTFQLMAVVLDPFTNESAWLLETAGRILEHFAGADCRVAFVVTGTADDARAFLGPWTERILTFPDPERHFVKGLGLNELPALVHIRQDRAVLGAAEGWDPAEWRLVAEGVAAANSWIAPVHSQPARPLAPSPAAPPPASSAAGLRQSLRPPRARLSRSRDSSSCSSVSRPWASTTSRIDTPLAAASFTSVATCS